MKNKYFGFYLLSTIFFFGLFYACVQDENLSMHTNNRFFDTSGADKSLKTVANLLKEKNASKEFVTEFVEMYGYPVWKSATSFLNDENLIFAVPVKSTISTADIEAIWFFSIASDRINGRVYTRALAEQTNETWIFDYFTNSVLTKLPKSRLQFEDNMDDVDTRGFIHTRRCVTGYTGGHVYQTPAAIYCWYDISFVNENFGGGGTGDYGSLDDGRRDPGFFNKKIVYDRGGGGDDGYGQGTYLNKIAPKARYIFRNSNMIEANWKAIEKMLDKIVRNCLGNALYQGLINHLDGKTLTIQFNKGDGGNFGMQGYAGAVGISISDKMEDNQLLHEMVHAYIAYQYANVKDYNASNLNHEIETHYIEYLYLSGSDNYKGSKYEKRDIDDLRRKSIKKLELYIDNKGNLLPGVTDNRLELEISSNIIPALELAGYTRDKYHLAPNMIGTDNFKNLKQLTKDC